MNASANNLSSKLNTTSSGFTLIELMVTIAVLAIIVGIAAPSISTQLANQRVKLTTATLANALKEAKAESLIRRQKVELSYDNNDNKAGEIKLEDENSTFATYKYDAKSTIKSADDEIKFKPSKTVDAMVFTICDSNTNATPRQVAITSVANITVQTNAGATC